MVSSLFFLFFSFLFPNVIKSKKLFQLIMAKSVEKQCERSKFNFLILLLQEKNKVGLS